MKILLTLTLGILSFGMNASALQTAFAYCTYQGNNSFSNNAPGVNLDGFLVCPGGILPGDATNISGYLALNNDYSTGNIGTTNTSETYFTNMTLATIGSALISASGLIGSTTYSSNGSGLAADGTLGGNYFDDPLMSLTLLQATSGFDISFCEAANGGTPSNPCDGVSTGALPATQGLVGAGTGAAIVVYSYDSATAPEPGSFLLLGSGLLGLSLVVRKKLARR